MYRFKLSIIIKFFSSLSLIHIKISDKFYDIYNNVSLKKVNPKFSFNSNTFKYPGNKLYI